MSAWLISALRTRRAPATVLVPLMGLLVCSACSASPTARAEGKPDGEQVFEQHKCEKCHKAGSKRDLAKVGSKRDAKWMKSYLRQEEKLDGKKHVSKFKGDEAELEALVAWLAARK